MGALPGDGVKHKIREIRITLPRRARCLWAVGLLAVLAVTQGALSQTTGRITGGVRDSSEAAIAGAEVTALSKATRELWKVTADRGGHYSFLLLPPGAYDITVGAKGFKTSLFRGVSVTITETTALDVALTVGEVFESVSVNGATPLVQADGPQLGRVVDFRMISGLPLATRNITQILSLLPGTATYLPDNTAVGRNTQTISVNGARMTQNNYQINGVDANTMGTSSAVNVAVPAPESVQELKVQTSLYDATFGRAGGANVQVLTKSGTNSFHGEVYEYFRNEALNANNPFLIAASVARPALKRNVFGGTLGGPLRKKRAFFFLSYQGTRERNGASLLNSVSSNVLIAPGLTDDRSQSTLLATFHPLLNGQPATRIDPVALALLNVQLPNGAFAIPTPQADGRYSGSAVSRFQEDQFNTNADFRINAKNSLSAKAFVANAPSTLALPSFRGTGPNVPGFSTEQENNVRVIVLQDTHAFRANFFNEARVGYNRHRNGNVPAEPLNDSNLGIRRANSAALPGLPLIRVAPAAGGAIIGTPTDITPAIPSVTTVADTLSLLRDRHFLRAGVEIRYNTVDFTAGRFTRGQIDFTSFLDFLVGATSASIFGGGIGERSQRAWDYNFFAQDDWKISPKLTLNLGLRYELDLPPYDTRGRVSTFDPLLYGPRMSDSSGNPVGPPLRGIVQAGNVIPAFDLLGVPNVSKYVVTHLNEHDFAPRIGFAYSPFESGKVAVRGGYGIFDSRATFAYLSATTTLPPLYVLGRRRSAPLADPFFPVPSASQFPTFVPGIALSGTIFDRNLRTPYFQQYNMSVQYGPRSDLVFELAYVGTRGLNLFRQLAINQARLASLQHPIVNDVTGMVITTNTPTNAPLRAPFQGVEINGFFENQTSAQSSYNSLQLSATRRLSRGLQVLASYTFAKSLDNGSGTGGGGGINGIVNPGAVSETNTSLGDQLSDRANRGVSDFDRTHRFVLSYVWDLRAPSFFSESSLAHRLLSDWKLAGVITAMSGLPIDIVDTAAGSFYGLDRGSNPLARPNLLSGNSCQDATTGVPAGYYFSPFVFVRPVVQPGQTIPSSGGADTASLIGTDIGNVGRNCLRGPQQVNVDFAVVRSIRFKESVDAEFRVEFFNLFNHANLANPISDLNAVVSSGGSINLTGQIVSPGAFGQIISTSSNPRLIQLAVKFRF